MWNVNTIAMGGLGEEPELEGAVTVNFTHFYLDISRSQCMSVMMVYCIVCSIACIGYRMISVLNGFYQQRGGVITQCKAKGYNPALTAGNSPKAR